MRPSEDGVDAVANVIGTGEVEDAPDIVRWVLPRKVEFAQQPQHVARPAVDEIDQGGAVRIDLPRKVGQS